MKTHSPARKLFGFTLLELLVVISIIGILVAIGAASFSVAQRQGRNARRRADMKTFQNCIEQARSVGTVYAIGTCDDNLSDPGALTYAFQTEGSPATGYCAAATLEGATGGNCNGCTSGAPTAGDDAFCVTELQ